MSELIEGTIQFNIKQTIASLLFRHPFYGFLIQTMKWREDNSIPTLATNGKEIIYNSEFFNSLPVKQRVFAIAHELGHCIFSHCYNRRGSRDKQYWNMAIDYKVNALLKKDNVGEMRTGKDAWLYEPKYDDMSLTSEEIYDDLVKNKVDKKESLDVHLDAEQGNQGDSKVNQLSSGDLDKLRAEFQQKVVQAHQFAKMAGNTSSTIETLVHNLLNPRINWRKLLQTSIQSLFKSDTSWQRPNKRTLDPRFILPSMQVEETVDICVSIDTSGSISEDMKKEFLSEIAGILKYYKNFRLSIWCFDTAVHNLKTYNQSDITEINKYVLIGGGGTDIACNFDFMKQNKIVPKHLVVFTDGWNCSSNWGPSNYCKTTWIIHSNNNPQVPFGKFTLF